MKTSAFTLVELLVSTSVVAVLAGIAVPVIGGISQQGKLTNDLSNLRQIAAALQAYQGDNNGEMPRDQGGHFIVSAKASDQNLLAYTGSSFEVWHSSFDPRAAAPGDSFPVSYSLNGLVLAPASGPSDSAGWTGRLTVSVVPLSALVVASPSFTFQDGVVSWNNVASNVTDLQIQGQGMFPAGANVQPSPYSLIPTLFADSHVELVSPANYQNLGTNTGAWALWDPMSGDTVASISNETQLGPIDWDSDSTIDIPMNANLNERNAVHAEKASSGHTTTPPTH